MPLGYPCRCLCFGLTQITRTTPRLLIILQRSHRRLTDAETFILILLCVSVALIFFPQIALFLRDLAFAK